MEGSEVERGDGDEGAADGPRFDDLSPEELRVLGCLIEKEATVPDTYPLTLNSLRSACNQSTSRDPVVAYGDHEIERALVSLRARGLTRNVHSTSNRAMKYRHVLPDVLDLDAAQTALMCVLMLRGPQTVGELKTRTERQHRFASPEGVGDVLAELAARSTPLARELPRQPGQKDNRWVHLLAPAPVATVASSSPTTGTAITSTTRPAAVPPADPYGEATSEFYDLLATEMWETFGLQLLDLLDDVDPADGPIVDVGVGTGVGLQYLVEAVPDATVFAIEPSKAMRVALHARLHDRPELLERVTVSPTSLSDTVLPAQASGLVASAVLGHLTARERERLWRYIAESMPAGAPAVVGVLPPDRPMSVPLLRYAHRRVGDHVYEGWQSGEPIDERSMTWTLVYRVLAGDRLVAEYRSDGTWRCDGIDDLRVEIATFGLTLTEHDHCVVIRRATA